MKQHCAAVLLVVLLAACSAFPSPPAIPPITASTPSTPRPAGSPQSAAPALALTGGTLIDGTGEAPIRDAILLIRNGRIEAAGPRGTVTLPPDTQTIDVHGAYNLDKLEAWAQAGVTTVRDLGARSWPAATSFRDQASPPRYAHLVSGGVMITPPGGYPIAVFGGRGATVSTPAEAGQAASDMLDQGAAVIKIALESGRLFNQRLPVLSQQQVAAIVEVAHRRGTVVSAHVTVSDDLAHALDGGVDDVAHMVTDPLPDELIRRMVADGVTWEPTLELWNGVGKGIDGQAIDNLRRFAAAGGRVALGTDYEGYTTPFQLGMPLLEMGLMQKAGLSPMQILVAGTRNAARVCNRPDLGTLRPGQAADVLVVQGDPLQDLRALGRPLWVIHAGMVIRSPRP